MGSVQGRRHVEERAAESLQDPHGRAIGHGHDRRCSASRRTSSTTRAGRSTPTRRRLTGYGGDGPPTGPLPRAGQQRRAASPSTRATAARRARSCCCGPVVLALRHAREEALPVRREGRAFEFDFEVLNVFDNINFNHVADPGGGTDTFQVTSAYTDINTTSTRAAASARSCGGSAGKRFVASPSGGSQRPPHPSA